MARNRLEVHKSTPETRISPTVHYTLRICILSGVRDVYYYGGFPLLKQVKSYSQLAETFPRHFNLYRFLVVFRFRQVLQVSIQTGFLCHEFTCRLPVMPRQPFEKVSIQLLTMQVITNSTATTTEDYGINCSFIINFLKLSVA